MTAQNLPQTNKLTNMPENQSQPRYLSDLIIDYLELLGVEYVFGVPGGQILPFLEALDRSERRGGPRCVFSRHETGAAFMADGYARETGKIGVCFATTGPGITNLITGIASAYAEHIPLLIITAQVLVTHFGRGAGQDSSPDYIDTNLMLDQCTSYTTVVTNPNQLEYKLVAALKNAMQSSPGPAHLNVPVDIFRSPAPPALSYPNFHEILTKTLSFVDLAALEDLWQALCATLNKGKKVVLFLGRDCRGASEEIIAFAESIGASVVTTQPGKSWIDLYHPLYKGVFGFAGHKTAREALSDESVDLILAVGTSLSHWGTSNWDKTLLNDKLVHIHYASTYFERSPMARLHIYGNIKTVFQELVKRLKTGLHEGAIHLQADVMEKLNSDLLLFKEGKNEKNWLPPPQIEIKNPENYQSDAIPIKPQRLFYELIRRFPPETRFITDICNGMVWWYHYFFRSQPEKFPSSAGAFGSMGWAIGAAVGTAMAAPNTPVVSITGDGCFLMSGQEITVAVAEKLPVIYVILNDQSYGMVKQRHRQIVKESMEFSLPKVDFSLMAKAMGANGYNISTPEDFDKLDYQAICNSTGPTILDVHIDPEELSPLGMF